MIAKSLPLWLGLSLTMIVFSVSLLVILNAGRIERQARSLEIALDGGLLRRAPPILEEQCGPDAIRANLDNVLSEAVGGHPGMVVWSPCPEAFSSGQRADLHRRLIDPYIDYQHDLVNVLRTEGREREIMTMLVESISPQEPYDYRLHIVALMRDGSRDGFLFDKASDSSDDFWSPYPCRGQCPVTSAYLGRHPTACRPARRCFVASNSATMPGTEP